MSKSERPDARPQAAPVQDNEDLGFDLDDDEIDLDLPDWPDPADSQRASDTAVPVRGLDTPVAGARSVRADDLGPLGDGSNDDFDLPLPGRSAAAKARDGAGLGAFSDGLDADFDFDVPAPQAASKSQTTPAAERPRARRSAQKPTSTTTATKAAPARKAPAESAPAPDGSEDANATSSPVAKKATRSAGPTRSAAASPERPAVADAPNLPSDPGYDVLPAGALVTAKPRNRLRIWITAAASLALVGGLGWLGTIVFGGGTGPSPEIDAYELARARAAGRARPNSDVVEAKFGKNSPPAAATGVPGKSMPDDSPPAAANASSVIEIGVAYGTEKRNWLEWAAQEFAASDAGQQIRVQLIPMGSLESAHAILDGDQRIHVWSPASSLYRESLLRDWEAKYQGNPILKEEPLALTPMVLVMWKSRYEAFTAKCPTVSLRTIDYAMRAPNGWMRIAGRPAWGRFEFGHTHPNQSNSGLMTLIMLAYEFFGKKSGLTVSEIMSPQFQDYVTEFRAGVAGVSHSTGTLMKEMTLKGPTCYDALLVYENLAIEYAESAEGRWDSLQVIYPEHNLWNENPYCILNTPWTTAEHQRAAEKFLSFLLSEPIQTRALDFGFRPANPRVPVKGPTSPFAKYAKYGLAVDLATTCEVPSREVMENLQQSWIRCAPARPDGKR